MSLTADAQLEQIIFSFSQTGYSHFRPLTSINMPFIPDTVLTWELLKCLMSLTSVNMLCIPASGSCHWPLSISRLYQKQSCHENCSSTNDLFNHTVLANPAKFKSAVLSECGLLKKEDNFVSGYLWNWLKITHQLIYCWWISVSITRASPASLLIIQKITTHWTPPSSSAGHLSLP